MATPPNLNDSTSLGEARKATMALAGDGVDCPCCEQRVKVYKRPFRFKQAFFLLYLVVAESTGRPMTSDAYIQWAAGKGVTIKGGDHAKVKHWKLAQPPSTQGGPWSLTTLGRAVVAGTSRPFQYAHILRNAVLEYSGDPVTLQEALGDAFDASEIVAPAPAPPPPPSLG